MKSETAAEAVAYCEHRRIHRAHDGFGCCTPWEFDLSNANELVEDLAALGWMVVPSVSLPDSAPKGDPATAAERIEDLTDRQWAVHALLAIDGQGMTDEELVERYCAIADGNGEYLPLFQHPKQTPQSIRSRRAELVRAGHVVKTSERRPTSNGGTAAVWRAADQAGEVAA